MYQKLENSYAQRIVYYSLLCRASYLFNGLGGRYILSVWVACLGTASNSVNYLRGANAALRDEYAFVDPSQ